MYEVSHGDPCHSKTTSSESREQRNWRRAPLSLPLPILDPFLKAFTNVVVPAVGLQQGQACMPECHWQWDRASAPPYRPGWVGAVSPRQWQCWAWKALPPLHAGCIPQDLLLRLCMRSHRLSPMYLKSSSSQWCLQWGERADPHTGRVSWGHVQVGWQKYCSEGSTAAPPRCPYLPSL